MKKRQLILVYNANSDLFSSVTDFAHKIISPSTYQCELCALTHGNFIMKQEWKSFLEALPVNAVFLYKDEFLKQYKTNATLPTVFIEVDQRLNLFITKEEIKSCGSLTQLKSLFSAKISSNVPVL